MSEEQPKIVVRKTVYVPINRPGWVPIIFKREPKDQQKPTCAQPSDLYRSRSEDLGDVNSK